MLLFCVSAWGQEIDQAQIFHRGNEHYLAGRYQEALTEYDKLLKQGIQNGYIYYNIANCYYRLGSIGGAIEYYLRAQKYLPRNSDLRANLEYARKNTLDKIESHQYKQIQRKIMFWYYGLNKRELLTTFIVINIVFWLLLIVFLYSRKEILKWGLWAFGIVNVILIISLSSKVLLVNDIGVVKKQEVNIYSGIGKDNVVLFKLHEGTQFEILDEEGDWFKLKLADGKKGWVKSLNVAHIKM
jgi:tetratricopeptide (TPR) repeat protein